MSGNNTEEPKTLQQEYEAIKDLPEFGNSKGKWIWLGIVTLIVVGVITFSDSLIWSILGVICELIIFIIAGCKQKKNNNSNLYDKVKSELNGDSREHIKSLRYLIEKQIENQQKYGTRQMKTFTTLISWFGITSLFQAWSKKLNIWFPVIFIAASIALIAVQHFLLREDKLEKLRILDNVLMSIELEKK